MRIELDALSRFAVSMTTCLSSGMGPGKALELSAATGQSPLLRRAAAAAAKGCAEGFPISDGLNRYARYFPGFFIPLLRAGEVGGRQVEAFQLVHDHCRRLVPALRLVRNVWLLPAVCILAGWVIRTVIFLYFGMYGFAWQFVRDTFVNAAGLILVGWGLLQIRPVRAVMDAVLLQLPLVRETLLRISVVLFFSTFRLGYEAGGLDVLKVFDLALDTVPNAAVRKDLARARPVLAGGGSFEEAFGESRLLKPHIQSSLATGALSGNLGASLGQIAKSETLELEVTLAKFNAIFYRLVAYGVALSVVGTLLMCIAYSGK